MVRTKSKTRPKKNKPSHDKQRQQQQRISRHRTPNTKYPRKVKLEKDLWIRTYCKEEKKYFLTCNDGKKSSWNPWNNYHQIAPWMATKNNQDNNWSKFKDDLNNSYCFL